MVKVLLIVLLILVICVEIVSIQMAEACDEQTPETLSTLDTECYVPDNTTYEMTASRVEFFAILSKEKNVLDGFGTLKTIPYTPDQEVEPDVAEKVEDNDQVIEEKSESEPVESKQTAKSMWGFTEGDVISGTASHYDVCKKCCGKTDGITASGVKIQNGVQPSIPVVACGWLPLNTIVDIDGVQYVVADRGGGVKSTGRVDIFVPEGHQAALNKGIKNVTITVVAFPD